MFGIMRAAAELLHSGRLPSHYLSGISMVLHNLQQYCASVLTMFCDGNYCEADLTACA